LASLINKFDNCQVIYEANNGADLISKIKGNVIPDVILLDLSMPVMDGLETANWLKNNLPQVHVLMLTMYDADITLIRLLQAGVKGFLKKDVEPTELKFAINSVIQSGYYYSSHTAGKLANLFRNNEKNDFRLKNAMLTDQEIQFLKLNCSDLNYKEIAKMMDINPRTVDAIRDKLFLKLGVTSRVGLAMIAIRNGLIDPSN
jgi:DNA-binding NarL/FixJ family response regulator